MTEYIIARERNIVTASLIYFSIGSQASISRIQTQEKTSHQINITNVSVYFRTLMTSNNKTYNHQLYEDFFEENKPDDILSSDVTIDSDAASRYIDITL